MKSAKTSRRSSPLSPPPRTVDGSAFACCPVCGRSVLLHSINDHIDAHLSGGNKDARCDEQPTAEHAAAASAVSEAPVVEALPPQHAAADAATSPVSEAPAADALPPRCDPDDEPAPPLAAALRWRDDAVLASRRQGQHTGRAVGVSPPTAAADAAMRQLAEFDEDEEGGEERDDFERDVEEEGVRITKRERRTHLTYDLAGHIVVLDFLSISDETRLVDHIENDPVRWKHASWNGLHRGKAWGVEPRWGSGQVAPEAHPFPDWLNALVAQIRTAHPLLARFQPNHCNAILYVHAEGHYLSAHVDDRALSGDLIVNVSLAGDATMTYTPMGSGVPPAPVRVLLPRRCLQIQSGSSRYSYTHAIDVDDLAGPRRLSLTLRAAPKPKLK